MDKKFKEVRNVLNMKNIIGAGIVMGTLFVSTSAFAAEQDQETTRYSIQDRVNNGSFNFQNQFDNDFASLLNNLKQKAAKTTCITLAEQRSNSTGNSVAQTQAADSLVTLDQVSVNEGNNQDQATDVVEEQDQLADGNEMIQDQLSANENAQGQFTSGTSNSQVQDIYNEIEQIKAGFGAHLSQIQDSYKYNNKTKVMVEMIIHKINLLTMILILHKMQMVI